MENCERYCIKIIRFFVITGLIILVIWSGTPDEQFTPIIILLVIFSLIFLPRTEYYRQDRIRDSILEQDIINISENREEILARIKEHIIPVDKKEIVCSDECTICLDDYDYDNNVVKLICEHRYHKKCIENWLVEKPVCPLCKYNVLTGNEEFVNNEEHLNSEISLEIIVR